MKSYLSANGNSAVLYVRGCHSEMTGMQSDRLTSSELPIPKRLTDHFLTLVAVGGAANGLYCEYDSSFARPDSRGKSVTGRTLVEFCGTK